jgi:hypothetical protein
VEISSRVSLLATKSDIKNVLAPKISVKEIAS